MPLPTEYALSAYEGLTPYVFSSSQVAISQAAVALKINANAAASGVLNITNFPALYPGYIVAVQAILTANKTAGAMNFTPTINGTALAAPAGLVAVAMANAAKACVGKGAFGAPGSAFVAGDLIGCKFTTDGSYAPTTNDMAVIVWVLYGPITDM